MSQLDPYHRSGDWAEWPPRESAEEGDAGSGDGGAAQFGLGAQGGAPLLPPSDGSGDGGAAQFGLGAQGGAPLLPPSDGSGDGGAAQSGRHRARHSAAPDPYELYPDPPEQEPRTGSGWDQQATAEQPPALRYSNPEYAAPEPMELQELFAGGGRTGRPRGRRRADSSPNGRAGRNLTAAIGVGVTLGGVVLAALFVYKLAFLGVITVAICVAIWELSRAVRHSGAEPPLVPLLAGGVLMGGLAWYEGPDALSVGLLVTVLAAMVWRLADGPAGYQRDVTAATLVAVYVPFLGGFAALLAEPDDGALRVVVTLAAVVLSDTGGYIAGVFFGRHPMAPSVSPKKSWEGLAGSLVATGIGGALLLYFLFDVAPWWGAVFGLAISVAAVLGDLAESMLKRDLGIKDMSTLLPGHGGLMDRLDSILFALPAAYLLLSVFASPGG